MAFKTLASLITELEGGGNLTINCQYFKKFLEDYGWLASSDNTGFKVVSKNGNDTNGNGSFEAPYLTIQAATDAATAGDSIFIFPGTYTEVVTPTVNNLTYIAMGKPNTVILTQADATAFVCGAKTGILVKDMTIQVTAATSAIPTISVSTGSINTRACHLKMTNGAALDSASQCSIVSVTGAGTFIQTLGNFTYTNAKNGGATALKGAFKVGTGGTIDLRYVNLGTVTTSGTDLASTVCIDSDSTGVVKMHDCTVDMTCGGSIVVGLGYLGGTGTTHDFSRNTITIDGTDATNAYAFFAADTATTSRFYYNHISVTGATNNYGFAVAESATAISHFDDIQAANGDVVSGTLTEVSSQDDGSLNVTNNINKEGGYGSRYALQSMSEEVTIAVASGNTPAVVTTGDLAPANSLIESIAFRVTQAPGGGATTLDIGITGGDLDAYIDGASCDVLGETGDFYTNGSVAAPIINRGAATTLTLTTDADVTDTDMKVRVVVWYRSVTAPTS